MMNMKAAVLLLRIKKYLLIYGNINILITLRSYTHLSATNYTVDLIVTDTRI